MQLFLYVVAWSAVLATGIKPKLSKVAMLNERGVLLDDREIPTVVPVNTTSSIVYLHDYRGPFTLIVRACNSTIDAVISHIHQNNTGPLNDYIKNMSENVARWKDLRAHTFRWKDAPAGLYLVELSARHHDTLVTLFATKLASEPAVMHMTRPRVRIVPRLHRNRVTVRWDQSVVDPQMINYYIVVNSRMNFSSLCEAYNVPEMKVYAMSLKQPKIENSIHKNATAHSLKVQKNGHLIFLNKDDVLITFVGSGTSFTISNLEKGREYFFNIFAEHNNTRLSFLYASKSLVYDPKLRPMGLKDNKPAMVNIRRLGGRALFRYKVSALKSRTPASALSWHIMPCGSAVQVQVNLQRRVVIPPQMVHGYAHLQIPHPKPGERYALQVSVTDPEQMRQILGVEVLATTRSSLLPELPTEASVYEYSSLRSCDSVTVGWVPVLGQSVRYCVSASPVSFIDLRGHFRPYPNQCNLENRLNTQFDFAVKQCQDFSENDNRNVLIDTITKLIPDREYLIQVTVKKIKGKVLSYDLLRVRTNRLC